MSDDKSEDKQSRKSTDMARRIWLAGIGAYGRAFEEGRDMVKGLSGDLSDKTSNAFEQLAERGEKIEMAAKVKGAQLAGKASSLGDEVSNTLAIDERIAAMRERLSGGGDDRVAALEAKLASIEAKLDKVLAAQTPKKASPKRTTTQRTKAAPAKTAAANKTAAKKPAAKKPAAKKPAAKK
ncbi:MAG: phasin family protein [Pseudomonadota bacterium]